MKKTLNICQKIEDIIMVATFAIMVLAAFIQVVNRNITKIPVTGFEEAAKYCMVYMVLLGTEKGLRDGTQISVTALVDKLKGKARLVLQIVAKALVTLFSAIMFKESWSLFQMQITSGQTSPGLGLPMYIPYFALILSFAIITLVQLGMLITMCGDLRLSDAQLQEREAAKAKEEAEAYERAVQEEQAKLENAQKGGRK
ncbi:MAG: TRAP transporter small permease [Lachnospiraceae bacterium]|nr:TRAP transporter small permease [Lachnospiraceae bacterium]MDD3795437.1 TRAP transporter small permease [Lachnospiraceae bacterium]